MSKQVIRMGNREYKKIEKKYRKANETIKSLKNEIELEKKKISKILKIIETIDLVWDNAISSLESKIKFERKLSLSAICILAGIIIILVK